MKIKLDSYYNSCNHFQFVFRSQHRKQQVRTFVRKRHGRTRDWIACAFVEPNLPTRRKTLVLHRFSVNQRMSGTLKIQLASHAKRIGLRMDEILREDHSVA